MNRKRMYVLLVLGLVIALAGAVGSRWPSSSRDLESTVATPAEDAASRTLLVCYGFIDSRQGPLALQPTRPGRVTHVLVKENQIVAPGDLLVKLDSKLAQSQLDEAELGIKSAQIQLAKAQDGLSQFRAKRSQMEAAIEAARNKVLAARSIVAVKEKLRKQGFLSEEEADAYRKELDGAKALETVARSKLAELDAVNVAQEVELAQLQVERSVLLRKRARQELDEHELRAPTAGIVLRVQVQQGDLASPASGKPAVLLAPAGSHIVRAEVSQEFADRIRPGLPVQVEQEPTGTVLGTGTVAEVASWFLPRRQFIPEPSGTNTGLSLECTIALDSGHDMLRLGQRVRVRVLGSK